MTRDDIIRMAGEAGFVVDEKAQQHQPNCIFHTHHMVDELLERFAALVAVAEREAFVALVYEMDGPDGIVPTDDLLAAIRARGEGMKDPAPIKGGNK